MRGHPRSANQAMDRIGIDPAIGSIAISGLARRAGGDYDD